VYYQDPPFIPGAGCGGDDPWELLVFITCGFKYSSFCDNISPSYVQIINILVEMCLFMRKTAITAILPVYIVIQPSLDGIP
jgi:hypothetical protein